LWFTLAAGTSYQTTANTWTAGNYLASANQVNALDSTANNFKIALVQLEAGSTATPFEHRPYGIELALCQRYYWKGAAGLGSGVGWYHGLTATVDSVGPPIPYPAMRATPSLTIVVAPTYQNCTSYDLSGTGIGMGVHRLSPLSDGVYRAYDGVYSASAEL
jgi:hypothetical protein